jgi:hypothetical protein
MAWGPLSDDDPWRAFQATTRAPASGRRTMFWGQARLPLGAGLRIFARGLHRRGQRHKPETGDVLVVAEDIRPSQVRESSKERDSRSGGTNCVPRRVRCSSRSPGKSSMLPVAVQRWRPDHPCRRSPAVHISAPRSASPATADHRRFTGVAAPNGYGLEHLARRWREHRADISVPGVTTSTSTIGRCPWLDRPIGR